MYLLHHCVLFFHAFPHCQNYLIHLLFYCISPSSRTLSLQAQMPRVTGSLFISLGPRTKTGIQESLNKHSLKEWVNGFLSRFSHFLCESFTHIPLYTWIWSFPDYLQLSFNWKFHKGVPILTYIPWLYCIYWNQSIKFQNSYHRLPWWISGKEICLPMQMRVQSLVQEDLTYHETTKPMHHNYWALELRNCNYWTHVPQLLKPCALEPVLHNNKRYRKEKTMSHKEE